MFRNYLRHLSSKIDEELIYFIASHLQHMSTQTSKKIKIFIYQLMHNRVALKEY